MLHGWTTASLRWWRRMLPVLIGLLGAALVLLPTRFAESLSRRSYAWLHQLTGVNDQALDHSPILIVYMDRDSFKQLGLEEGERWPRELHAKLLKRLARAGAKAVVMDIIFSARGTNDEANAALADAIQRQGGVVLGEGFKSSFSEMPDVEVPRLFQPEPPLEQLRTNAAAVGLTSTAMDDDFVSRRHFAGIPALSKKSLSYAAAAVLGIDTGSDAAAASRWMRYYGPPLQIPHVSYYRALEEGVLPAGYFRDRVVFVGEQPQPGQFNQRGDEWGSPFVNIGGDDPLMPGVEIHATQMLNLIRGDWLSRIDLQLQGLLWLGFGLLAGWLSFRLRPPYSVPLVLVLAGFITILAVIGMNEANLWCAWLIPVAVQTPITIAGGLTWYSVDWFIARRQAERRIREQAELIDKAQDAIRLFDLEGRLQLANPRAHQLFDLSPGGGTSIDFSTEPGSTARLEVMTKGFWLGELKQFRTGGPGLVLASRWNLIRDQAGRSTGILVIDTDVTEQKELEAQLLRARRMEAVGTIAGGMAHDLNNSLAPLLMGVQLLKRQHEDEPTRRTLEHMESSARRGAEMVHQVLSFARGKGSEFTRLDAGVLVGEMARLARETFPENIRVETQLAVDLWKVTGNATQLHQVLLNLCVNARDALPDGGTLTLAADNVTLTESAAKRISGASPGDFVCLMISDTGTGIAPENLAKLFQTFFTTKPEGQGTGLGLPTVKRIVESHSGFIRVDSTPGEGTTIEVYLPKAQDMAGSIAAAMEPDLPQGSGQTILVVDDTAAVRELLGETLASQGYRAHVTGSPSEALEKVAAGDWRPDLVVLDLNLPGIYGLDLLGAIRRKRPSVPAVLISAGNPPPSDSLPPRAEFLAKPPSTNDLLRSMDRLFNQTSK